MKRMLLAVGLALLLTGCGGGGGGSSPSPTLLNDFGHYQGKWVNGATPTTTQDVQFTVTRVSDTQGTASGTAQDLTINAATNNQLGTLTGTAQAAGISGSADRMSVHVTLTFAGIGGHPNIVHTYAGFVAPGAPGIFLGVHYQFIGQLGVDAGSTAEGPMSYYLNRV